MTTTTAQPALDRRPALPVVAMGLELLASPLTRYQADAAAQLETCDAAGGYVWPTAVILWPRQTGKTTLMALLALSRARSLVDYRAAYAAQTGHITSQRFKEWNDHVRAIPGAAARWKVRDSDGTERISARGTGSYLRAFPPIPGRLRSNALDLVIVDEAQEHDDDRVGARLDADIIPVMSTRPRSQWIIAGTAGDAASTYWRRHYQLAAAGTPGRLLLEIGTPPPDADTDDPATWAAYHPGVRAGRTTIAKLAQAREALGPERFAREYFNRWTDAVSDSVFPPGSWRACHNPGAGVDGRPTLCLELAPDRSRAAIVAAGPSTAGSNRMHVELVAVLPIDGIVRACAELTRRYRVPIIVDAHAPAVTHLDALRRAHVPVADVTAADMVASAGLLFDRVSQGTLTHLDQPPLSAAAASAVRRKLGPRWAFERHAPDGHVITAAALALLAAERHAAADAPTIL